MEQLETGNIGIGNTSTLATLNSDRFIVVDQKEIFWTGASLKDAGRACFRLRPGYGGQVVFTKLAPTDICRIKKSAFAAGARTSM